MRSPARLLLVAQLSLFMGLFICVLLIPHYLFEVDEGGVSNYGTVAKTIIPYTVGFSACGIITIWAAYSLPRTTTSAKQLRPLLTVLGLLYIFVLLSTYPYKLSTLYNYLHQVAGAAIMLYSVGLGAWLSLFKTRSNTVLLLFAAQLIGFALAVLTHFRVIHILFIAELLESLAFGVLLVSSVGVLMNTHHTSAPSDLTPE